MNETQHDIPEPSKAAQRQKILDALHEHGALTTDDCCEYLGVMSPAARVLELRRLGHDIATHIQWAFDHQGVRRLQAQYRLGGAA